MDILVFGIAAAASYWYETEVFLFFGCVYAVSYTHLDVYKRQLIHQQQFRISRKCPGNNRALEHADGQLSWIVMPVFRKSYYFQHFFHPLLQKRLRHPFDLQAKPDILLNRKPFHSRAFL